MIYLDNAATTKPSKNVLDAYLLAQTELWGNPSAIHSFGEEVFFKLKNVRDEIKKLLGVQNGEIYFTSSATESINTFFKGFLKPGEHLITSLYEHSAVYENARYFEDNGGEVTYLEPINGIITPEMVLDRVRDNTSLVAIMAVNNEVGALNDIVGISKAVKEKHPHIKVFSDCVQAIGKTPINLKDSSLNGIAISPHKFHGLKGTGILYLNDIKINPLLLGGGQEDKMRSSTENVGGIFATLEALRESINSVEEFQKYAYELRNIMIEGLRDIEDKIINEPINFVPNLLNISFKNVKGEALVHMLEGDEIYVSTSSACSSHASKKSRSLIAMNVPDDYSGGTIRISFGDYNTKEEVEFAAQKIKEYVSVIRELMK